MRQLQFDGFDYCRPVVQKILNYAFILFGVIGAGRIDQGATRLEKIKSPEDKVTLQSGQFLAAVRCKSESTVLAGA